jgi:hypothetical protein
MSALDEPTTLARTASETLPALRALTLPLVVTLQATAFWTAALLPLTYPLLLAVGAVGSNPLAFLGLLVTNAGLFVLGHGYNQSDGSPLSADASRF